MTNFDVVEQDSALTDWDLAQLLFHKRGLTAPDHTYQSVFLQLQNEKAERLYAEEFWSDPCWTE